MGEGLEELKPLVTKMHQVSGRYCAVQNLKQGIHLVRASQYKQQLLTVQKSSNVFSLKRRATSCSYLLLRPLWSK